MSLKPKKRLIYLYSFAVLLVIEIIIGVFVHDDLIRPYVGDILVIILLCCFTRIVFPKGIKFLSFYIVAFGIIIEFLQLIRFDKILGVERTVLGIIIGSTFDFKDILCYIVGGLMFFIIERRILKG